jgi:hypothetical protein
MILEYQEIKEACQADGALTQRRHGQDIGSFPGVRFHGNHCFT